MLFSEKEIIENYKILYKNKFSSTNKNILMFEVKLTFQSVKQAHDNSKKVDSIIFILGSNFLFMFINVLYNIILQITNSSVHLMFPDSLWIINVLYARVSAPISSGTAIENRIYREKFTRKKCKTAILLYCFHTAGVLHICYITCWALEYHFIENLKLLLKENQIMK